MKNTMVAKFAAGTSRQVLDLAMLKMLSVALVDTLDTDAVSWDQADHDGVCVVTCEWDA